MLSKSAEWVWGSFEVSFGNWTLLCCPNQMAIVAPDQWACLWCGALAGCDEKDRPRKGRIQAHGRMATALASGSMRV